MSVADPVRPTDPPDHRRLGRQLDLFESHELVGAGLPLWLPDGAVIRFELERFVVELERVAGYQRVFSPVLGKRELFERSGHWQHFRDDMFPPMDTGEEQLVLRPSNCPHHLLMYGARHHSFRELPVRYAELGTMFRYERSGAVGGLSRARALTSTTGPYSPPTTRPVPRYGAPCRRSSRPRPCTALVELTAPRAAASPTPNSASMSPRSSQMKLLP